MKFRHLYIFTRSDDYDGFRPKCNSNRRIYKESGDFNTMIDKILNDETGKYKKRH